MRVLNELFLSKLPSDSKHFLDATKINKDQLKDFKFSGYSVPEMTKLLSDLIDESFEDILATYKRTKPQPICLTHDNSTTGDGRHISPGIVNIADVIAVNLTCDVIYGSYSASDN